MPITRLMSSPTSDSRNGRIKGMPPATAASKSRSTPCSAATAYSSGPCAARSSLLPVMTGLPFSSAVRTSINAGSVPPMSSMTMSTSGSATTAAESVVSSDGSARRSWCLAVSRTAIALMRSSTPVRAVMVARRASSRSTSAPPTVPHPRSPMVRLVTKLSVAACLSGPTRRQPSRREVRERNNAGLSCQGTTVSDASACRRTRPSRSA